MPDKTVDHLNKIKKNQSPPEEIHASYADAEGLHFDSEGEATQPEEFKRGGLEKTTRYSVHKPVQPGGTALSEKEANKIPKKETKT